MTLSNRAAVARKSRWIAYRCASTSGVKGGAMRTGLDRFRLKRNLLEYATGLAWFEVSIVLDYYTRRPESPVVFQRTTGQ